MIKQTFQQMADALERMAGDDAHDMQAHLLIHALSVADEHDIGAVRAFANGCDQNDYAKSIRPMLSLYAVAEDHARVRAAVSVVLDKGLKEAWQAWAGQNLEAQEGLRRFLTCKSKTRECRQIVLD